ncbi:MAG: chromosome segregation protein SMC, partial [Alphaproteobacteria bacterium]
AERALAGAETAREDAEAREARAREPLQQADRRISALNAEAKALRQVLRVDEGNLWPPVIDELTVEPGYETALGAAIGDDLEAPLDEAAPAHWLTLNPLADPPALPRGAQPLAAFVSAPDALARRLTQVGVVDAEEGAALQALLQPGQRLVSREGALWRWDGFTARADAPTAAAERLAQRNRLAELEAEIAEAEAEAARARADYHEAREDAQRKRSAETEARQAVRAAGKAYQQAQEGMAAAERESSRHRARLATLEETAERLRQEEEEAARELAAPLQALERLGDGFHLGGRLRGLRAAVSEARERLAGDQAALDGLKREVDSRARRMEEIGRESAAWAERLKDAERQITSLDERRTEAEARLAEVRAVPAGLMEKRAGLIAALDQAAEKRDRAADALAEAEAALAEAGKKDRAAQKAMSDVREERARTEARLDGARERLTDVIERIAEAMDCAPEQVLETGEVDPGEDLPPLHDTERRLEKLKRARDSMGPVNLRADHETQEYQEQYDSLSAERAELEEAITKLRQGIANLNREGRERLLSAFDVVNGHFKHLFTTLFSGGQAELQLVESDDPLEAGLEIMARPPGKRLQSMSLLSGGEQALTALSLIFAVFLSNPAPICVLDEVDAPLDDTNVERFCNLLDEMVRATDTRFIIITHHALTMSRMDRLYGVTMAERGVSQLVSVDLMTAEKVAAAV